jgi:hypothetical protein
VFIKNFNFFYLKLIFFLYLDYFNTIILKINIKIFF